MFIQLSGILRWGNSFLFTCFYSHTSRFCFGAFFLNRFWCFVQFGVLFVCLFALLGLVAHRLLVAMLGLFFSLAAGTGGYSLVSVAWASHCGASSCCGAWLLGRTG